MIDEFGLTIEMHTLVGMLHGQGLKELKQSTIQMAAGMGNIDAPVDETVLDIEKELMTYYQLRSYYVVLSEFLHQMVSFHKSPMHTKSLATLKHQILRNRLVATARKCMGKNASLGQVYGSMQEAYQHMQTPLIYQEPSAQ
ncbi:BORON TRANSPORTER 2-RELATED, partial [Salix purpurea]